MKKLAGGIDEAQRSRGITSTFVSNICIYIYVVYIERCIDIGEGFMFVLL